MAVEQPGPAQDAVDAGGATGHDVPVEHHEGQAAVALQGVLAVEVDNGLFLGVVEPVVAGDPGVVLVGLAVAQLPGVPLGGRQADPQEAAGNGDARLAGPAVDEVHEGVAGIVGNPASVQSSPSAFFSWTCSSISSERTSCLRWSLASSSAILLSLASVAAWRRLSLAVKAACPFSKKSFCHW